MLKFDNVTFGYNPAEPIIKDFCLEIKSGEFLGLKGKNGSGKSTLLKLADGLLKPQSGRILYDGNKLSDRKEICRQIGLVFQFPERQLFEETVLKDICFGPENIGYDCFAARERALSSMKLCGLDGSFATRSPFELSDGEKRLVAIAGVLAMDSKIIALDEPFAGLDEEMHSKIMEILVNLHNNGKTIILVSHEPDDYRFCSKVISIEV